MKKYGKNFSVKEVGKMLSVSDATVKNWIKLKKIKPDFLEDKTPYFSENYIKTYLKNLKSESSEKLKKRRNKKHISGSFFYKDYLSVDSKNTEIIKEIIESINNKKINLSKDEIGYIVADCGIKLCLKKDNIYHKPESCLSDFLNSKIDLDIYNCLIKDLIHNKTHAKEFIKKHSDIFSFDYIYEKNNDILGLLYISLSNLGERKSKGAYYTPTNIVKKVINSIKFEEKKEITDPCCGTGNFLLQLPDNIDIAQIYGNDIDKYAVGIARLNMALKYKIKNVEVLYNHFTNKNFLINFLSKKYDFIIGNPPWGADFNENDIGYLRENYTVANGKNIESFDVFIEKSLNCLAEGGLLYFVLPEAILTIKNHQNIREIISNKTSISYVEYLGNIFDKVQCPSIILGLKYTNSPLTCTGAKIKNKNKSFIIKKEREITPNVFSFSMDDEEYKIYKKVLSPENKVYLKNNADFALGIVTGDNKKYLKKKKNISNEIILKGSDLEKYKITIPNRYIKYAPYEFQQVAPTEYYRAKEKLFYKFVSKNLVFAYDNNRLLSLNSCNILIPKIKDIDIKYIMAILNSRVAQFIYEKKYNSVKVLRSHIENIPIPLCDNKTQQKIIKLVDEIISLKEDNPLIFEEIEKIVYGLYKLSPSEYKKIK